MIPLAEKDLVPPVTIVRAGPKKQNVRASHRERR